MGRTRLGSSNSKCTGVSRMLRFLLTFMLVVPVVSAVTCVTGPRTQVCADNHGLTSIRHNGIAYPVRGWSSAGECGLGPMTASIQASTAKITLEHTCANVSTIETYSLELDAIRWDVRFKSAGPSVFGPNYLFSVLTFPQYPSGDNIWVSYSEFVTRSPRGFFEPFPLQNETFRFGMREDSWDPVGSGPPTALPLFVSLPGKKRSVIFATAPTNLVNLDLQTVQGGPTCVGASPSCVSFLFAHVNHRILEDRPTNFTRYLAFDDRADARSGLRFLSAKWPETVFPDSAVNLQHLWGSGQYMDYRGKGIDGDHAKKLNLHVNWDATFPFPYWGKWLGSDDNFKSCVAIGHCDGASGILHPQRQGTPPPGVPHGPGVGECETFTFAEIRSWYAAAENLNIRTLLYANLLEFGYNIQPLNTTLDCEPSNSTAYCMANRDFRKFAKAYVADSDYSTSKNWNGSQLLAGFPIAPGVKMMDCLDATYRQYQLDMLRRQLAHTPTAGICVDRSDHTVFFNANLDDGVSYHWGLTSWLGFGYLLTVREMGKILHARGQAMFVSPTNPRLDLLAPFDGIYDEFVDRLDRAVADSVLAMNKPCIAWDHGGNRSDVEWHEFLQTELYLGCTPSVPSYLGDHTLTNTSAAVLDVHEQYAPLFALLDSKRWDLDLVIQVEHPNVWTNAFRVLHGTIVVIRDPARTPARNITVRTQLGPRPAVAVYLPGEQPRRLHVGGGGVYEVPLKRGVAVLANFGDAVGETPRVYV